MSNKIFTKVPVRRVARSTFDMSYNMRTSLKMGVLVPTYFEEVIPGDTFKIKQEVMSRMMPMISPLMHKIQVKTYYFFVPYRILWERFPKWITGLENANAPYVTITDVGLQIGSLGDYLELPSGPDAPPLGILNALIPAAYCKVYDEYFRSQQLQEEKFQPLTDGNNSYYEGILRGQPFKKGWMHDYFTSALPEPQAGDAVTIPLTNDQVVPVSFDFENWSLPNPLFRKKSTGALASGNLSQIAGDPSTSRIIGSTDTNDPIAYDPSGTLSVNINSDAVDIESFRRAIRLQEWLEKNARGGERYTEVLWNHFEVRSSDARLQRPEFIGSITSNMVISEVLSTAQTDSAETGDITNPVGNMAGHGIQVGSSKRMKMFMEEHGCVIGLTVVIPDTAYFQGVHKRWKRRDRLDYPWPSFAHLGEQPVYNYELYAQNAPEDQEVFGYLPQYSDFRFRNNTLSGFMRTSLLHWHLARKFDNPPALNAEFIESNPSSRIFAVEDDREHQIVMWVFNSVYVNRRLPRYSIPTL